MFDVRMIFDQKARWVKEGHKIHELELSIFSVVVSRYSVRITITYATMNDVPMCAFDFQNAHLKIPSSEKQHVVCGPDFGLDNVGNYSNHSPYYLWW